MAHRDPRLITVRRSTVVRLGMVLAILAALGGGIAIGLTVGSKTAPPAAKSTPTVPSAARAQASTTTSPSTTTTVDTQAAVLSCGPGSTPHVRPTMLTVGCTKGTTTVTNITWRSWAKTTGGQGTGTLNVGLTSAPAVVVVFSDVNGVFQDVSITPSQNLSTTTAPTTSTTSLTKTSTTTGLSPVAASQPGSGWGGN